MRSKAILAAILFDKATFVKAVTGFTDEQINELGGLDAE